MTITLSRFENGDVNYIGKHNSNADVLESVVSALQSQVASSLGTLLTGSNANEAMFGAANAIIGEGSYLPAISGTDLIVAPGYWWSFSTGVVSRKLTSTTIAFAGDSAGTYYVVVDATGEPTKSASSTGAAYSVAWSGSALSAVTRLVSVAWGFLTFDAAKVSTALAATYQSLDTRLEAGEAAPIAALAAHVAAADPHTGYQKESEKSAANGYASLDSGGKVPSSELPTTGGGSGSVTSVALALPAFITVSGSPVTASGTLTGALAVQNANKVLAGPATGSDAAPTFRALVAADIPALTHPYDVGSFIEAAPTASQVVLRHVFARSVVFAAGLAPSQGAAGTAATAQTDFDIQKNGSSVGTMRFAASGTTSSFIMASQTTFAAGDVLKMVAPGTPDATLAGITFTLSGTR